jgi:hypothetical protein
MRRIQTGILMRKTMSPLRWILTICLPFSLGIAASVQSQSTAPPTEARRIDGTKTPEQIPDTAAFNILFRQLTGPGSSSSRANFLAKSGLSEPDAKLVFLGAERHAEAMEEVARMGREMPRIEGQRPTPAQMEAYKQVYLRANQALEDTIRSFSFDLTPAGQTQLREFVLNHIKRNTSMVTGGSASPRPAGAPPPNPAMVPRRPDPFGGAANATEMAAMLDAASRALTIVHTTDEEASAILELWNASTKAIDVVRVAVCAPALNRISGLGAPSVPQSRIAPGDTAKMTISKASSPTCDPMTPRVAAVVFEDGTAAGLPALISHIKLEHLGRIAETDRIVRLFDDAGDSPQFLSLLQKIGESPSGDFETLRAAFAGVLSPEDAAAIPADDFRAQQSVMSGMSQVRMTTRDRLERLASNSGSLPGSPAEQWAKIRKEYRDRAAGAQQYRERVGANLYR